jgi:type I restriction enzyme S subunit
VGDLLFSWAGQLVSFGVHVWRGPPGVLNQHIFKITPKVRFEIAFLEQALSHIIEKAKHGFHGIEMKHITKSALTKYQLPFPPIELQSEFAAHVAEVRALEARQAASRRRLDDLYQSLLHRAFRGEL